MPGLEKMTPLQAIHAAVPQLKIPLRCTLGYRMAPVPGYGHGFSQIVAAWFFSHSF